MFDKPKVGDYHKEGFKVNYTKLKKAIMSCELQGKHSDDCKKMLKDLGIDSIHDE